MDHFKEKLVFLTGGSAGIGLEAARLFASRGAHVAIFARNPERLRSAAGEIEASKASAMQKIRTYVLDVSVHEMVVDVTGRARDECGTPDILVNNAGRAFPRKFGEISYGDLEDTMRTNLHGVWSMCAALVPDMKKRGGAIVNVSSMAGLLGVFGYTDYCASKFAVVGFSEALRQELSAFGVYVHVLCPPDTDTPGFETENRTKPEETRAISAGAGLMKPAAVAEAMLRGITKGDFLIIPGFDGKTTWIAKRLVPGLVNHVIMKNIKNAGKKGSK
jgi:short-subunit dehydrogenase